ncbi:hypothetical protein PENDEC_c036G05383 [Penicillium decumbens]|uniref:Uncharacterized protein n=1 Tax=Penicillium decumbens TaxID=69771 RepID=A0A1V6NV26_PENDC|nr:hypothetical protein PENDEC_c036G05383 [Penicillium decumbens]
MFESVDYGPVIVCRGDEQANELDAARTSTATISRHYQVWGKHLPESEHPFRVGVFGKNQVARKTMERNTRIGDIGYVIRSPHEVAFKPYLQSLSNVTIYSKTIQQSDSNTDIYCCFGQRLMNAVQDGFGFLRFWFWSLRLS